jgi:hypothetical protein
VSGNKKSVEKTLSTDNRSHADVQMCGASCEQIAPPQFPADSPGDILPGPTKAAYLPFQFGGIASAAFIACQLAQRRLIRTSILWGYHITFVLWIQVRFWSEDGKISTKIHARWREK